MRLIFVARTGDKRAFAGANTLDARGANARPDPGRTVGEADVASGANSDGSSGTTDPGIRLLTRIGDFVEPLTRFDRGHLSLEASEHAITDIIARQTFRVTFETRRSEGNGPLPPDVTAVADAAALARESAGQLASARAMVPHRLATWAEQHGENPLEKPSVADCFIQPAPLGHVETCAPCNGAGKIPCSLCNGAGTLTCETCSGRGQTPCATCNATGETVCATCKGMRTVVMHKERKMLDGKTGKQVIEHVQETVTCGTCAGNGKVKCARCSGRTEITCATCHGQKTIACTQCQGSGSKTCETCGGHGRRYFQATLACAVKETFETTVRATAPETAAVLKGLGTIEQVLKYAGSHRATSEINADTLRRDTVAAIPVTAVTVQAGKGRAQVHGFGPNQEVLDYRNIAGMLLTDDLVVLEEALPSTSLTPPKINGALLDSLSVTLASEAHVTIAESAAKKDISQVEREFRGVVTGDYIRRAGAVLKTALGRYYWASLAKGPVAALAAPLLYLPVGLLVRSQGQGATSMALLGVMLITFFAALAAHYWVLHQMQKRLAPAETPRLSRMIDRLGLTLQWLGFAGMASIVLTLGVMALTNALFPPAVAPPFAVTP
jgi:hypothetical protein